MQNDELRRAQQIAEEARARYEDLYESAPIGYLTLDENGIVSESNLTAAALLGRARASIRGRSFLLFLKPASRQVFTRFVRAALRENQPEACEVLLKVGKKAPVVALLEGKAFKGQHQGGLRLTMTDVTSRKEAEEQLVRSHQQLHELAIQLQHAREEECTKISREVHDELGQALTLLKLDIAALQKELAGASRSVKEKLLGMEKTTGDTIRTVQDIAIRLRPMVLDRFGLLPAIQWWGREFQSRTQIRCEVELLSDWTRVDRDRSLAVFRIFQEALTNVARHSQASKVEVKVGERDGLLRCEVWDNGRGITTAELSDPTSPGLAGMRQRIALLGGDLLIVGSPGKGTTVVVTLPPEDHRKKPRLSGGTIPLAARR